jgi:trk system potassium uptake protein TrkH
MGTGGLSNRASSIASYGLPSVEWLICIFMLLAGSNFSLFHYALQAKWKLIYRNSEFRAYLLVVLVSALVSTLALTFAANSGGLRQALFHVASVISTTGYSVSNQDTWPALAQAPVFFLMFVGGCTGSTAGGIKVLRWLILCKQSKNEMRHLLHPQGVFSLQLDGGPGKREVVNGIAGFVFVYLFLLMAGFIIISLAGVGLADSLNASLMCLGNIGLAFSSSGQGLDLLIQGLPVWVKVFCSILMLIGRLELWAALVFFNPKFWRR